MKKEQFPICDTVSQYVMPGSISLLFISIDRVNNWVSNGIRNIVLLWRTTYTEFIKESAVIHTLTTGVYP